MTDRADRTKTLRSLLRDADPAFEGDLTSEEVAELRARSLAARPDGPEAATPWWRIPAFALLSAGAVLAIVLGLVRGGGKDLREPARAPETAELPAEVSPLREPSPPAQRIEFETPEGLRIVWIVNPDFTLDAKPHAPQENL